MCLTCSCKIKAGDTNNVNSSKQRGKGQDDSFTLAQNNKQTLKQKFEICKDQRIPIFNKKIENLPSLEYFLQNYSNFLL